MKPDIMNFSRARRGLLAALAATVLLGACAGEPTLSQSRQLVQEGRGDEALALLDGAARQNPGNRVYREEFFSVRDNLITQWFAEADAARLASQFDRAEALYRQVMKFDPDSPRAASALEQLQMDRRHGALVARAEALFKQSKYHEASDALAPVLNENPGRKDARRLQRLIEEKAAPPALATLQLKSAVDKPISLELRNVSLRTVFEVLSRATGLNFLFDKELNTEQTTSVVVRDEKVEAVIRQVLVSNQLEDKVLSESTALIYPATPQKLREYQELAVRSFYVSNADVRETANMLRTILDARHVFVDEKLNLLVIKDTPDNIRRAGRLIAAQDLAQPEVMLQVEVLEIGFKRLLALGARYPSTLAWSVGGTDATGARTPGTVSLPEWLSRDAGLVQLTFTDPLFLLSLQQQDGSTNLLANPRIRVKNREKATVHIGDRVPVITTTAAATGSFVSQSISYLDVGLKLEVEPIIYLDDDVGIKVGLEVSNITNTIQSATGDTLTYQIGTRTANTTLRAHDGETQVLAGLISDEDRRSADRVPGLGDLPIIGRLFSSTSDNKTKTEIVLLITPHIVRSLRRPEAAQLEFPAGTEATAQGSAFGMSGTLQRPMITIPLQSESQTAAPAARPNPAPPAGNTLAPFGGMQSPGR
ncbi:MAG: secretin N-terminal domain-containing protein [Burkholderiales bacterium]